MIQQGQVFKLKTRGTDGRSLWPYRYRLEGRGSTRPQVGGFATREQAEKALRKVLDRHGPGGGAATMTLGDLVGEFLEMHQAEPVTISKLRWLLGKATAALGEVRLCKLSPKQVYAWRLTVPEGTASRRRRRCDRSGAQPCRRLGPHRLEPGQARHPQRSAACAGEATVRVVATDRSCRREARPGLRADDRLCGRDRPSAVGAVRTRAA